MPQLGLALSGGGFRATLYHLGVIRFLKDLGELKNVTHIASVSGGSILATHLVLNWDRYTGDDKSFNEAAAEIVAFAQFDVRNHIVRRYPMLYLLRLLAKVAFRSGRNLTPNAILERHYRDMLYGDRCLYELPEKPVLHILTTNVSNGGLSVFNRDGLFIQERGDTETAPFYNVPAPMARLSRVVGASSAFPGFFPPVEMSASDLGVREGQFPTEWFTDGGVYDNLGIRAFSWLKRQEVEFDTVLVSDAGKPFQILNEATLGFVGQSVRASDILWDRVWQLERENFGKRPGYVFLPITDTVERSEDPAALHPVVQTETQNIRTDLDRFSDIEVNALVQHGYGVARKVCRENGVIATEEFDRTPPWAPIPEQSLAGSSSPDAPSSDPSSTTQIARTLRKSSRRRVWATLPNLRDWPTYVYLAIVFFLLIWLPFQAYDLYERAQMQQAIIDSIAQGDPDIRQILDLADADPMDNWTSETVREKSTASEVDYSEVEILTHNRIYDLRDWYPEEKAPDRQGHVYVRDRITLKLLDGYSGDRILTLQFPSRLENVEYRQPKDGLQAIISEVAEPFVEHGQTLTLYEFEYDLSHVPLGEPVPLEAEIRASVPETSRARFRTRLKTDLISVWMLFPSDRPYRSYDLVSYPADKSTPPMVMDARYTIDHPYGSLIGWSVVNPTIDTVYECRWVPE
jgi:predicted acylesterase/phospholipase RssA